jgi:hypothetical protein
MSRLEDLYAAGDRCQGVTILGDDASGVDQVAEGFREGAGHNRGRFAETDGDQSAEAPVPVKGSNALRLPPHGFVRTGFPQGGTENLL